ncbi:MAG: DUF333 domain-containing protein [Candidatus Pacebacteria bacterium]|nr:DUF333 domain-containing protein [Candidatus Paceibacterota bacterium]
MSKKFPILILLLLIIPLIIIAKEKRSEDINQLFSPNGAMYFTKEWSRTVGLLIETDPERRIGRMIEISDKKLEEIKIAKDSDYDIFLNNYFEETKEIKLAISSLKTISSDLLGKLIIAVMSHKEIISSLDQVDEANKETLIKDSSSNILSNALNISLEEDVIDLLKKHCQVQDNGISTLKNIDLMISLSERKEINDKLLAYELNIIKGETQKELSTSEIDYLEKALEKIKTTDYYKELQTSNKEKRQKDLYDKISSGKWIDEIISTVSPEEVEELERFKTFLIDYDPDSLDDEINDLQIYDETKSLLRDAKDYIISSFRTNENEFIFRPKNTEMITGASNTKIITNPDNPASAYCLRKGYKLEEINDNEKITRNCIIDKETVCEEWSFYKGECGTSEKIKE